MIDLYSSRRKEFIPCTFWARDKTNKSIENYTIVEIPTDSFMAGIVDSIYEQKVILNNFMMTSKVLMIYTNDSITIKEGDSVKLRGIFYRADTIQRKEHNAENEFTISPSKTTYIQLKGK